MLTHEYTWFYFSELKKMIDENILITSITKQNDNLTIHYYDNRFINARKSLLYNIQTNETNVLTYNNNFLFCYKMFTNNNLVYFSKISFVNMVFSCNFILNSFRLKPEFQNNYKISNFIPVYNTDDFLITIFNENEEVYKHFLWKDKKVYEIETERRVYMFNFRCFNI